MAATLTGLIHESDGSSGLEYALMSESIINDQAGWAGDYQQFIYNDLMPDEYLYEDYNSMYEHAYSILFVEDTNVSFSIYDLISDVDAVNLYVINQECSNMSEAMAEYYSELMDDRYSLFEDNIDLEHIDMYSKKRYFIAIWPIYGSVSVVYNSGFDVGNLSADQWNAIRDAFLQKLNDLRG